MYKEYLKEHSYICSQYDLNRYQSYSRNAYTILAKKCERIRPLGRPSRIWGFNNKGIWKEQGMSVWTAIRWLRVYSSSGLLLKRQGTFGLRKKQRIPCLFKRLLAAQKILNHGILRIHFVEKILKFSVFFLYRILQTSQVAMLSTWKLAILWERKVK